MQTLVHSLMVLDTIEIINWTFLDGKKMLLDGRDEHLVANGKRGC